MALEALAVGMALATSAATDASASLSQTQTIKASGAQMLELAEQLVRGRKVREAETILDLLARDPDSNIRNEARFRHAKLLVGLKRPRAAALLLRRLLDEKPSALPARLELAQMLQQLGDTNAALRELRAVQASGLPPTVSRLIDRYSAALRARRPYGASLEIAIAPDSNINRATRSDTLGTIFGNFEIADEGKAKSGTGLALNTQAFRRFGIGADSSLLVRATGIANLYRRSQFNDLAADLAVGPEFSFGRDRLQLELGATRRWFGQKPFMRSARVGAIYSHPFGPRTLARVVSSASLIDNQFNDLQDGRSYFGQVQLEHALSPTAGIAAQFSLDRQALKDPGYSTTGWRAGLTGWHELGRMTLTIGGEVGRLHADERLLLFPDRRSDRYERLSFGASFRQLQYAGFAPVLRLSIERNRSSIAFYDYRRTRSEIGIVRAF